MDRSKEVLCIEVSSDPSRIYFFDLLIVKYHIKGRVGECIKFLANIKVCDTFQPF